MTEWTNAGSSTYKESPITAAIRGLPVGASVTVHVPQHLSYNAPASAAGRLQRTTEMRFQWRRIGDNVEVKRVR